MFKLVFMGRVQLFSVQWRKEIRKSDDSDFGWLLVKRLNETKEEERLRLTEARLLEERRANQAAPRGRGRGGHGPRGRGGQSASMGLAQASGTGDNVICSWCQVRGHKITKCRVLDKDYNEGRAMYDSNLQRYIRLDAQMFANPPPATQGRGN